MSDPNYAHEFNPNKHGLCKYIIGGRKHPRICHLPEDAEIHVRAQKILEEREESQRLAESTPLSDFD